MKTTRILSILLALTILTGSVPYGYAYCMMMKRTIDSTMQVRCNAHRETSPGLRAGVQYLSLARSMIRFMSKSTTDSYEHSSDPVNVHASTILMLIDLPSDQPIGSTLPVRFEIEHPPPDIVIKILNLRI